jgi:hypothetical protein
VIENPFYSPESHGEFDLVGIGHFTFEEGGSSAAARIETTGGKQGRR